MPGQVEKFQLLDPGSQDPSLVSMTFPKFRRLLFPRLGEGVVGVKVLCGRAGPEIERPLGLGLGTLNHAAGNTSGELLSLYVLPSFRGQGIGTRLLTALENAMRASNCVVVETVYMTSIPSLAAFEALLQTRGWSQPVRRMRIFKTTTSRLREASWMPMFQSLPAGFKIVRWDSVGEILREDLKKSLHEPSCRIPKDVNPFLYEGLGIDGSPAEPEFSFGCLHQDRIVGWHLTHRPAQDQLRFSCSYVRLEVQEKIPLLALWNHTFQKLMGDKPIEVSWAVAGHHEGMEKFTHRLLGPFLTSNVETRGARKPLL